eukprot:4121-Heterococcus_DN1.PRE.1
MAQQGNMSVRNQRREELPSTAQAQKCEPGRAGSLVDDRRNFTVVPARLLSRFASLFSRHRMEQLL